MTGAGSGIGAACAPGARGAGGHVCVVDRDEHAAGRTLSAVTQAGGNGIIVVGDVRDPDSAVRSVRSALEQFGDLSVLVNNAGGMFQAPVAEISDGGWSAVVRTNLDSAFYFCRAAAAELRERRGGAVVNVASVAGLSALAPHTTARRTPGSST